MDAGTAFIPLMSNESQELGARESSYCTGAVGRQLVYAGVIWCLIAYSRSSAFVLTFNVSIIRYL
jgi:hypothetical protein